MDVGRSSMSVNFSKRETTRHYMPPNGCAQYHLWNVLSEK